MKKQHESIKGLLDNELEQITYSKHTEVIQQLKHPTYTQRLKSLWNKEIELPLLPFAAVIIGLLLLTGIRFTSESPSVDHTNEIVEIDGNMYWKSDIEKLVAFDEN